MDFLSSVREIKGVGAKTEQTLNTMGVYTVRDILLHFPRTYLEYPKAVSVDELFSDEPEGIYAVRGALLRSAVLTTKRMPVVTASLPGSNRPLDLIWYHMSYMKNTLKVRQDYIFYGTIVKKGSRFVMEQPKVFSESDYALLLDRLNPIYSVTKGIASNAVSRYIHHTLEQCILPDDYLPIPYQNKNRLLSYAEAMYRIHFPDNKGELIAAHRRFAYDDFFLFSLFMQKQKRLSMGCANTHPVADSPLQRKILEALPYSLTDAQKRALDEINADLASEHVMQRLIQGDVGSGKTILAFLAMLAMAEHGMQSAIMVPTEVLARQHYEALCELLQENDLSYPVVLLTGSLKKKEKQAAHEQIASNENCLIVGTHALITETVSYCNLGLVITDEQHRFGVRQRETFQEKGHDVHMLVMSATPIPRTLAIVLYKDLDVSIIDELPANRLPIKNCVVAPRMRPTSYRFIYDQIQAGHQAYVICPLVEMSESMEGEDVISYPEKIAPYFPDNVVIEILHGKMKSAVKQEIMERFARNEIQILVSTTVIEVGINVPNATVMMIENAERFGLAQLHQIRGRVGRGGAQSYCIMINSSNKPEAKERLDIMNRSNDGFYIAQEDLKLRGPGDFIGIRQSGEMQFAVADIFEDADLLQAASEDAEELLQYDEELILPQHAAIRKMMEERENEVAYTL
jgi:ATP-dependent DNA helicase RecG